MHEWRPPCTSNHSICTLYLLDILEQVNIFEIISFDSHLLPTIITHTITAYSFNFLPSLTQRTDLCLQYYNMSYFITGKSSAVQYTAQDPLEHMDMNNFIISKCTSSGFVKRLATNKKGIILSPEVFNILNKLFK